MSSFDCIESGRVCVVIDIDADFMYPFITYTTTVGFVCS